MKVAGTRGQVVVWKWGPCRTRQAPIASIAVENNIGAAVVNVEAISTEEYNLHQGSYSAPCPLTPTRRPWPWRYLDFFGRVPRTIGKQMAQGSYPAFLAAGSVVLASLVFPRPSESAIARGNVRALHSILR